MVREWLKSFFRLLLKYKGVVRLAKAAEKAVGWVEERNPTIMT